MLDAGITIDKVSKFMGHASITVTIDRYGHLLPGGEAEAAEILNEYHARRRAYTPRRGPPWGQPKASEYVGEREFAARPSVVTGLASQA
jgi:hypothetical protein